MYSRALDFPFFTDLNTVYANVNLDTLLYPLNTKFTLGSMMKIIELFLRTGKVSRNCSIDELVEAVDYLSVLNETNVDRFTKFLTDETIISRPGWNIIWEHRNCDDYVYIIKENHIRCLEGYIKRKGVCRTLAECAIKNGRVECLDLLIKNGCILDEMLARSAVIENKFECLKLVVSNLDRLEHLALPLAAIDKQDLNSLNFLIDSGCCLDELLAVHAVSTDNDICLELLVSKGCPISENVANGAAGRGNYNCLRILVEGGCEITEQTAYNAANNFDCLKLLIENGCKLSAYVMSSAAVGGSIECIKLLISVGCDMNEYATISAIKYGNFECLKLLINNGCKIKPD